MAVQPVVVKGREPVRRHDRIDGSYVIISAARSLKGGRKLGPAAYRNEEMVEKDETCPFCPGREDETPEELVVIRANHDDRVSWSLRGSANLFPILTLEAAENTQEDEEPAVGASEIIIETPRHNGTISSLSEFEIVNLLWAVEQRAFDLRKDSRLRYMNFFKNWGKEAGASKTHPHSQLMISSHVPELFEIILFRFLRNKWKKNSCLLCAELQREREAGRVVCESKYFTAFVPFAAKMPYHLRIAPNSENCNSTFLFAFKDDPNMRHDFARILKDVSRRVKRALQGEVSDQFIADPPFIFTMRVAPFGQDHQDSDFHWFSEYFVKTTTRAGYEESTGEWVNPSYPEEIAEQLRSVAF